MEQEKECQFIILFTTQLWQQHIHTAEKVPISAKYCNKIQQISGKEREQVQTILTVNHRIIHKRHTHTHK